MRMLTAEDFTRIAGTMVKGYQIEAVRVKRGDFTDSDHYGIILGRDEKCQYVTWQFHMLDDDTISVYWGHYFTENREAALRDYENRDLDAPVKRFEVTITETLKLAVEVEADTAEEAEQIVSGYWHNSEYVLDANNFVGAEFTTVAVVPE